MTEYFEKDEDLETVELTEEELEIVVGGIARTMMPTFAVADDMMDFDEIKGILQERPDSEE
ncbi:MAG: hypothetical protein MJ250_03875 [Alphaproteobacteria bacterium]|nr:hypothetical protein [Alphaproteobacteria bacterium]